MEVEFFQSNSEGDHIDRLYAAHNDSSIIAAVINPGGTCIAQPKDKIKTKFSLNFRLYDRISRIGYRLRASEFINSVTELLTNKIGAISCV